MRNHLHHYVVREGMGIGHRAPGIGHQEGAGASWWCRDEFGERDAEVAKSCE
jgi:hypothetical protein